MSNLKDPDALIPIVKIMPVQIGGGPLVFRCDQPDSWMRIGEELRMLIENSEDGDGVTVCKDRMTIGDFALLPEHQGW